METDGCLIDTALILGSAVCAVLLYDMRLPDAACLMSLITIFVTIKSLGRQLP